MGGLKTFCVITQENFLTDFSTLDWRQFNYCGIVGCLKGLPFSKFGDFILGQFGVLRGEFPFWEILHRSPKVPYEISGIGLEFPPVGEIGAGIF